MGVADHFGLGADPFSQGPEHPFFYLGAPQRRGLDAIETVLRQGSGFAVITGDPGVGKTTLLGRAADIAPQKGFAVFVDTATAPLPEGGWRGLLADWLEVSPPDLEEALTDRRASGPGVALFIDDADALDGAGLSELDRLAALCVIVLAGRPALRSALHHPQRESIRQRMASSCHLSPLTPKEGQAYIQHRMNAAGAGGRAIFSLEASATLARAARGVPAAIGIIGRAAMERVMDNHRQQVIEDDIRVAGEAVAGSPAPAVQTTAPPLAVPPGQPATMAERPARETVTVSSLNEAIERLSRSAGPAPLARPRPAARAEPKLNQPPLHQPRPDAAVDLWAPVHPMDEAEAARLDALGLDIAALRASGGRAAALAARLEATMAAIDRLREDLAAAEETAATLETEERERRGRWRERITALQERLQRLLGGD